MILLASIEYAPMLLVLVVILLVRITFQESGLWFFLLAQIVEDCKTVLLELQQMTRCCQVHLLDIAM